MNAKNSSKFSPYTYKLTHPTTQKSCFNHCLNDELASSPSGNSASSYATFDKPAYSTKRQLTGMQKKMVLTVAYMTTH